jgi:hypothetical protein
MFMLSCFEVPKGVLENIDYYRSCFFGKMIVRKRGIDLLNGILYANQEIKAVYGCKT